MVLFLCFCSISLYGPFMGSCIMCLSVCRPIVYRYSLLYNCTSLYICMWLPVGVINDEWMNGLRCWAESVTAWTWLSYRVLLKPKHLSSLKTSTHPHRSQTMTSKETSSSVYINVVRPSQHVEWKWKTENGGESSQCVLHCDVHCVRKLVMSWISSTLKWLRLLTNHLS